MVESTLVDQFQEIQVVIAIVKKYKQYENDFQDIEIKQNFDIGSNYDSNDYFIQKIQEVEISIAFDILVQENLYENNPCMSILLLLFFSRNERIMSARE